MRKRSKISKTKESLQKEIIRLGDSSIRKSYYTQFKEQLNQLEEAKKRAEESEEKFRVLFESIADGILVADIKSRKFQAFNNAICQMLGYSKEEILKLGVKDIHSAKDLPYVVEQFNKLARKEITITTNIPMKRKDGSIFYADIHASLLTMANKQFIMGIFRDITERKRAEEALHESKMQLEMAIQASNIGLWDWDLRTNKVYFSPEWKRQIGDEEHEISNDFSEWQSRVHPEDLEGMLKTVNDYIKNPWPNYEVEFRFRHKDGSYRWILAKAALLKDENGVPLRMLGSHLDITERKKLEHEREKFILLADSSSEFIGMCDLEMNPIYVNPAGIRMVGLPDMRAACSVKVQDYFFPEDQAFIRDEFFPRVLREGHGDLEIRLRHFQTGEPIWMFYYLFSVRDANGTPIGWATVSHDITERKRAEEELFGYREHLEELVKERTSELEQANIKLQELDRLKSIFIASMSHELRTPLNSIIGFIGIILQGMVGEITDEQREMLQRSYNSAKHLLALISDVIDISKIEAGKIDPYVEEFMLEDVVNDALSGLKSEIEKKGLLLEIDIPKNLRVKTDRRRLLQCILNYLSNAVKFTEKGKVRITASLVHRNELGVRNNFDRLSLQGKSEAISRDEILRLARNDRIGSYFDYIEIIVEDTGIGIKEEDIPMLFESFVRLKSPLKIKTPGTGLGLYLTKKLVNEVLKGEVSVKSRYGKGSRFTLIIPINVEKTRR